MKLPDQNNKCEHSTNGWCNDCVHELWTRYMELKMLVRSLSEKRLNNRQSVDAMLDYGDALLKDYDAT